MNIFKKKKLIVTHNGTFHADDIFATAALSILFSGNVKIVRTRDEKLINKADFVLDVGGVYDESTNRYDHHQPGGAGSRANGIPYAAFGLVWKKYGVEISGSKEVAEYVEEKLVQPIDANDNGVNLFTVDGSVGPYLLHDILFLFRPSWSEVQDYDKAFLEVVELAKKILSREIKKMQDNLQASSFVKKAYEQSSDKRIVLVDGPYPWSEVLGSYPEPIYAVFPKLGTWRVECVRKEKYSFENRKSLPASWAGLRDTELAQISGVPDAVFCHNGRFMAVTKSKQGALALATKALEATSN